MDYKKFFGFHEAPFHLTPDPAYFFPSDAHREALQTLLYSIRAGEGFVQITGDPGTGKTLLIRTILRELRDEVTTALIFNPRLSPHELLRTLLEDLGLDPGLVENLAREPLLRRFRDFLLAKAEQKQRVVVIIDEAQNLPLDTLEELRLLSNLETEKEKLLQIILVGQRELEAVLERPEVRQLHQRITIRYRLEHLRRSDIPSYIGHRLRVATPQDQDVGPAFAPKALEAIFRISKGTPRLINIVCERSLMAAYVEDRKTVEMEDVKKAYLSIKGNTDAGSPGNRLGHILGPILGHTLGRTLGRPLGLAALALLAAGLGLYAVWMFGPWETPRAGRDVGQTVTARLEAAPDQTRERIDVQDDGADSGAQAIARPGVQAASETPPPVDSETASEAASVTPPEGLPQADSEIVPEAIAEPLRTALAPDLEPSTAADDPAEAAAVASAGPTGSLEPDSPAASGPIPPDEAFSISPGGYFVQAVLDQGLLRVWRGTEGQAELVAQIDQPWPHGQGLFLLGSDPNQGAYVFNHAAFLRGNPTMAPSPVWADVAPCVRGNAVPVIALEAAAVRPEHLVRAKETVPLFHLFINAWENMRIDELFELHGNIVTNHYLDQEKPLVWSWAQSYQRKNDVFRRSGFITVQVNRPVFLLDPANPESVMAVYHQIYRSRIWQDEGTKVLYFSLQDGGEGKSWKVVAELWVEDMPE